MSTFTQSNGSYKVYKVRFNIAIPDPDMLQPRYHVVIFVETNPSTGDGKTHHVTGDLVTGMQYQSRADEKPENDETFHSKELVGVVKMGTCYPDAFEDVCRTQQPPPKQKRFNPVSMRTEQVKADGTFYSPGEVKPPMVKCTEWVERQAIPALMVDLVKQA